MPTSNCQKFLLLTWKNWLLQYRRPVQTLFEIVSPILFPLVLVILRSLVDAKKMDDITFEPFCTLPTDFDVWKDICTEAPLQISDWATVSLFQGYDLYYSPRSPALKEALQVFKEFYNDVIDFKDSTVLNDVLKEKENLYVFASLQFDDSLQNATDISTIKNFNIKLRFREETRNFLDPDFNNRKTNVIHPSFKSAGLRQHQLMTGASPSYHVEFFLGMQHLLTLALIAVREKIKRSGFKNWLKGNPTPKISMRRFPHTAWFGHILLRYLLYIIGLVIMLSFVYSCINLVKSVATEKEKQLKESMKIMGLPSWLHWSAWFTKYFIFLFISAILIVLLLKIKWIPSKTHTIFTCADATVMVFFLLFYVIATICFCFMISVMFDKANTAAAVAGLAWFLTYLPFLMIQKKYDTMKLGHKLLACLFSNSAMGFGFQLMLMFEGIGEGVQWRTLFKPPSPDDSLTLGCIILMLILDSILYMLITLYIEAVFPGEFGVPKPRNFFLRRGYWSSKGEELVRQGSSLSVFFQPANVGEFFEPEPYSMKVGVQITNLRKVFHRKAVVKDLSLNMYEDQITVLLGHNGAGKTTTMSMLTGMITPTSGTAKINGYDICTDMDMVRHSLGLCPQHNIIFDKLTVEEHLYFFSRLKGLDKKEIKAEIDKYVQLLELEDKRKSRSSTLSGGMKRKLCVGMALCGNSKVVMLDEPTAGMDPSARRALWELLKSQKPGRTMLLSTHFMDEADLLGDRIAIMAKGGLRCCGSSFFLKKKYGAGYSLILDKEPDCDPAKVTALLQNHISNIEIHGNVGSELTYLMAENQASKFQDMLKNLEDNSKRLKVASYGISLTTMEEVFMKVGADHGQGQTDAKQKMNRDATLNIGVRPYYTGGIKLITNQYRAMFMKRYLSTWRSRMLLLLHILPLVSHVLIAAMVSRGSKYLEEMPPLPLDLDMFDEPVSLVQSDPASKHVDTYLKVLNCQKGTYEKTESISKRYLEEVKRAPLHASMNYLSGASFEMVGGKEVVTAWFNNNPFHAPAVSLSLMLNTIYKETLKCDACSITFYNYPISSVIGTEISQLYREEAMGFQMALNLGFGMSFLAAFYVLFIVKEHMSKSKHLQFVSGVGVWIFWLTTAIWDTITFILPVMTILMTLSFFKEEGYRNSSELGRLLLILFLFSWSFLPLVYIMGQFFKVPSGGYVKVTVFTAFTGVAAFLVINLIGYDPLGVTYLEEPLDYIFGIFPHYNLVRSIYSSFLRFADNKEPDVKAGYYEWKPHGIGKNVVFATLMGFLFYMILLCMEFKVMGRIRDYLSCKRPPPLREPIENEDADVTEQKQMIRDATKDELLSNYTLVLRDVTKYYGKLLAVNRLCLVVKKYECFGLLGINGAGKTTTFQMMTGDVKMSSGDGWVNGYSIRFQLKNVQQSIGYCPQFDALLEDMTAKETITMFALLRGIRYEDCAALAETLASEFDFKRHLNKKVKFLSGGNKRKVSTAIAIIGDPPVIYLDEPTTGMDPATKRYLWNAICKIRDSGKCVVLTSHSMEECEALCTRMAIMVNGHFKCIGSSQHLKNKFAKGYNLSIKLKKIGVGEGLSYDTGPVENFVKQQFPKAKLREKHEELMNYYVKDVSRPWSELFAIMEWAKRNSSYHIEDYSLGQGSLEQVFLGFTRLQKPEKVT